jgi:hypothetical protein
MLNKLLPIKFSPEQYLDLKQAAAQEQISMARLIRVAVQKELERLNTRARLSDVAQLAQGFPSDSAHKTDDEVIYDL